ncbi:MAG TPA: hypothetical protein VJH24_03310 [Candidatus Bilamarchaeaceae archaeon]|nr:hypothetical protein [Candidatus Bilamarchaeaceae archaeon]
MGEYENVTLDMVYKKLQTIEEEVKEISEDLHRVKPEFVEKLKQIEKGKFHTFKSIEEMEKHMDESE